MIDMKQKHRIIEILKALQEDENALLNVDFLSNNLSVLEGFLGYEDSIKSTYAHLYDEESKQIYINRLLYSVTGEISFIRKIVENTEEGKSFNKRISGFSKFVIFGCGIWGSNILEIYPELEWLYALDNNPKTDYLTNRNANNQKIKLKIRKYVKGAVDDNTGIVISSRLYHKEIEEQLINDGVNKNQIVNAGQYIDKMAKKQYFDLPYLEKDAEEVFVDAGAFDGETSVNFCRYYNGEYKEIIAFEPDNNNIIKLNNNIEKNDLKKCTLVPVGLWDKKMTLSFESIGNGSSMVSENGLQVVNVDRLDDLVSSDTKISFIKMDLEGSEYKALLGSERTRLTILKWRSAYTISLKTFGCFLS